MGRDTGYGIRDTRPSGVTLVELLVVLALLGIVFGVSTVALASLRPTATAEAIRLLQRARAEAIRSGRPVQALVPGRAETSTAFYRPLPPSTALFLPDGRAIGPGVDPLTGAPIRAAH